MAREYNPSLHGNKNNEWTRWYAEQIKNIPVQAVTSKGDIVKIDPRKSSEYDWKTKYVTKSCAACSLNISQEQTQVIARKVWLYKRRRNIRIPTNPQGICIFGVNKFLVENPSKPIVSCRIGQTTIEERVKEMRDDGKLKTPHFGNL